MISENIKNLRTAQGLTQKELAEKLHVTSQAVSRWENGEVEPSVGTISSMAEIFNVSIDELIGGPEKKPKGETVTQKEYVVTQQKPVLAVCEQCNKPIYDGSDIVRKHHPGRGTSGYTTVLCKSCDEKNKKAAHEQAVAHGLLQRKRSFLWGGILTALILGVLLAIAFAAESTTGEIIGTAIVSLLFFPFLSCIFLQNNFIEDMFLAVSSWGFVQLPGLIFTLDLDGIIWLLTVKLAFWILGGILAVLCFLLAVILGLVISIFVYPYAIIKNIKHPELSIA